MYLTPDEQEERRLAAVQKETQRAHYIRRGYQISAVLGTLAMIMFIVGIVFESGKIAAVGGIVALTAVIILISTVVYQENY